MSFFAELKRRNVLRTASRYAVVAWLLIQIVTAIEGLLPSPRLDPVRDNPSFQALVAKYRRADGAAD